MFSPLVADEVQRHLLRARDSLNAGRHDSAIVALRAALSLMPALPEPHYYLAGALRKTGKPDEAAAEYRLALRHAEEQDRSLPAAALELSDLMMEQGLTEEAVAYLREVVADNPALAEAAVKLGGALLAARAYDDAVAVLRQAVAAAPRAEAPHVELGTALLASGQYGEALDAYRRALRLDPANAKAGAAIAQVLVMTNRPKAAIAACEDILAASPEDADAHMLKGTALLLLQRWREGFAEYAWRWRSDNFRNAFALRAQPQWRGEDLHGKTIAVFGEQGFGDTIQFAAYLPLLAALGATVVAVVQPPLARLIATAAGVTESRPVGDDRPLAHDYAVPIMNLGLYLADAPPVQCSPYLAAPEKDAQRWKAVLPNSSGPRIGLAWAGATTHISDRQRSIPLAELALLGTVEGVSLVSLQQGPREADQGLDLFRPGTFTDFADTAALIEALDLVISVDTVVAHLAGAMGKPVWVLLPFHAEWRWGVAGDTSPWYPTMRLFRQTKPGDWGDVMRRVVQSLETWRLAHV